MGLPLAFPIYQAYQEGSFTILILANKLKIKLKKKNEQERVEKHVGI